MRSWIRRRRRSSRFIGICWRSRSQRRIIWGCRGIWRMWRSKWIRVTWERISLSRLRIMGWCLGLIIRVRSIIAHRSRIGRRRRRWGGGMSRLGWRAMGFRGRRARGRARLAMGLIKVLLSNLIIDLSSLDTRKIDQVSAFQTWIKAQKENQTAIKEA